MSQKYISLHTIQRAHPTLAGAQQEIPPGTVFTPADAAERDHLVAAKAAKVYVPEETAPPVLADDVVVPQGKATGEKPLTKKQQEAADKAAAAEAAAKAKAAAGEGGKAADDLV